MMSRSSLRLLPAVISLFALPAVLSAAVPSRIRSISPESRVELPHSVSGRAKVATDVGEAPAGTRLEGVTLHFNLTAAQQADLSQLLIDQQNPSSPHYHQWLTPEQYGARFGVSSADLAQVTQWLASQGLSVTGVSRASNLITFSGTVAQIEAALGTSMHTVTLNGEQHIANVTNPKLPSGLAAVVSGVTGLSNFRLKPRVHRVSVAGSGAEPKFTSSISGSHFLAPGDFYTIYDINPLLTGSINGTGITIAVMGQTDISLADVAAFRTASGLAANPPTVSVVGTDPGTSSDPDEVAEAQLDVEWSGAVAPNATVLFVNSNDVLNVSLQSAITNNVAPIISISYGLCEPESDVSSLDSFNQLFQEANAQGQTVVGPAGDAGATDCDYLSIQAAQGLNVDFPASSPYVTGMGGTEFNEGIGSYWSTTNGTTAGSATSYIPEMVWNDSGSSGLSAGGGGTSQVFSKPAWQVGNGVPADGSRDVPDLSFSASPNHDPYLICASGSCVSGFRDASSNLNTVGGTSVSAPAFAGVLALLEQKIGSRVGNANPILYALANSSSASTVFHDVTVGNNESACIQGTLNCPSGGNIGYTALAGYDLASGWGSVDVFNLVNKWNLVTALGTNSGIGSAITSTTVTANPASCGISTGSTTLNVQIANDSGTPLTAVPGGTVQIFVDGVSVASGVAVANGAVTYTLNTVSLTSGPHTATVTYSGDATFAGSKGTLPIDVVSTTQPDFALTPCTSNVTATAGATSAGVTYTVQPFNGFTGSVSFAAVAAGFVIDTPNFSVSPVVISSGSGTTVLTITASQTTGHLARPVRPTSRRTLYAAGGSGIAFAALLLIAVPRRRRLTSLLAALVTVGVIGVSGCGSNGTAIQNTGTTTTGTTNNATAGTYAVTVIATATTSSGQTLTHSSFITFTVQ